MRTLVLREGRAISPNVRVFSGIRGSNVSKYKRPLLERVERVLKKAKMLAISFFLIFVGFCAIFEIVKGVFRNPVVRTAPMALKPIVAQSLPGIQGDLRVSDAVIRRAAGDPVRLIQEENRYRVDMTRENNRLIDSLLSHAERMTGRILR